MQVKIDVSTVLDDRVIYTIAKSKSWYKINRNNVPFLPATATYTLHIMQQL